MTMQQDLFTLLSTGATDAAARVYPVTAPAATVRPYLTYQRISASPENILSGSSGLVNTRLQIDMFADTYAAAQALAAQVAILMAAWVLQTVSLSAQDLYEAEEKLHRVSADYSIWHT